MGEPVSTDELITKWGVPAGAALLGIILLILASVSGVEIFTLFAVISFVAAAITGAQALPSRQVPPMPISTTPVPPMERQARLQEVLAQDVAVSRGRLESVTPYSAVIVTGRPVNHILHLLLTVFLCGFWLPIWVLIALTGGEKRSVLAVDQCGNISRR
ncbi:gp108 protein [Mycolicibacterium vaccae ATCC 25954]|uniref:Gp108 protein n=1 Tax=Mycolicibacterium vaccae ATCC 25954 TaxID=1194972 RepID=K0UZR8_MYCVA|nr:gp108 protein [Mycolicibacterium vaccae ATCC 25954]